LKSLRAALDEDRTKTFVVEISPLGLVEMTRQNVTDGVREIMTRPCPTCGGEGVIKSEETLAIDFERRMREIAVGTKAEALLIQMNPRVSSEFTRDDARVLHAIEHETGKVFVFEGSEGLPLDHFAIVLEGTREEVLERAVPFRVGEEVHVQVVEPHMYSPGDAVAKVDGYVISITGGGPYVGEKHLVRINEAGRTAAVASLLDAEPGEAPAPASTAASRSRRSRSRSSGGSRGSRGSGDGSKPSARKDSDAAPKDSGGDRKDSGGEAPEESGDARKDSGGGARKDSGGDARKGSGGDARKDSGGDEKADGDGLQSKPRRRGRRGGRRRSGAKADSAKATSSSD
jgi:ribonuclease G